MRKGISDIVAVVLMIAVAISIGIFVTIWVTDWVSTQTSSPSITCAIKANYIIEDAKFNYSGKDVLLVKITNKGDQELYGFGFTLDNITRVVSFNSTSSLISNQLQSTNALYREQSTLISLNMSNSTFAHPTLAKSLAKLKVTNDACSAVSAETTSITNY
jgi:flagellin-like protein